MESLIHETHKGRNMRRAACAARYIMQTACVAVSNMGTNSTAFRAFAKKKFAFFNRPIWAHVAACECQLSVILSSDVPVEKLIYQCASRRKCIGVHDVLLKSDFMSVRFLFVRRVRARVPESHRRKHRW